MCDMSTGISESSISTGIKRRISKCFDSSGKVRESMVLTTSWENKSSRIESLSVGARLFSVSLLTLLIHRLDIGKNYNLCASCVGGRVFLCAKDDDISHSQV